MEKIIGIDLGTTNSAVAVLEGGEPKIITNFEGGRTTPSVVAFNNGEIQVGEVAKRQAITNPQTISSIKRHMGDPDYQVAIQDKNYTPPEISAMILQYLKRCAENYLGEKVTAAVITVPAYFNDAQRQATKDAGKIAGLEVKRIINEPTASALAYGLDKKQDNEKVLVYDLGGGTFDVSILELGDGVFQVLATNGNTHLGGDDFDQAIMDWLIADFKSQHQIDLSQDKMALQRLKEAAEKAKIALSGLPQTEINLPFIANDPQGKGPLHLQATLSQAHFNELTANLVQQTQIPVNNALKDADLTQADIDQVILNGGATRIPAVQASVEKWIGKKPDHSINPDEAVALGAAIQGGVITGEIHHVVLLDVTPMSLGLETSGGLFTKLIDRNTLIPASKSQTFSTATDNQEAVDIHVLQGERPMAIDNKTLGRFQLRDIPPAPRGVPQIEVTFEIDKNGIVQVSAKNLETGKMQKIVIQSASGLSQAEIERMTAEAQANAAMDEERRLEATVNNAVEQTLFNTTQLLHNPNNSLAPATKKKMQQMQTALTQAQQRHDLQAMQKQNAALQHYLQPGLQTATPPNPQPTTDTTDDDDLTFD